MSSQPDVAFVGPKRTTSGVEVSVVIPCLNEATTIGACVSQARSVLEATGVSGEVVVADNGSEDDSAEKAQAAGARVISVAERGYGGALRGGIDASLGRFVVLADADGSHDMNRIPAFLDALARGYDLVVGNRFEGGVGPGALPWLNRYVGNPILSGIGRLFFPGPVRDFHCGQRAFTRAAYDRMGNRSTGMEFASEMIARASLARMRLMEIPVPVHRAGRDGASHLRPWRDGMRHIWTLVSLRFGLNTSAPLLGREAGSIT